MKRKKQPSIEDELLFNAQIEPDAPTEDEEELEEQRFLEEREREEREEFMEYLHREQ